MLTDVLLSIVFQCIMFIMKNMLNEGMVVYPYNPSSWVVEEKASDIEDQPQIGSEFEVRLGYMRYWLKKKIREGLGRRLSQYSACHASRRGWVWSCRTPMNKRRQCSTCLSVMHRQGRHGSIPGLTGHPV